MILCENCGHRARYHTGLTGNDYANAMLACRFETDRYEVCSCDKLKVKKDTAQLALVKADS